MQPQGYMISPYFEIIDLTRLFGIVNWGLSPAILNKICCWRNTTPSIIKLSPLVKTIRSLSVFGINTSKGIRKFLLSISSIKIEISSRLFPSLGGGVLYKESADG